MPDAMPRRILIVEDDQASAELELRALIRGGMAGRIVGSIAAAKDALIRESFAAVILDYRLPDGDSWEIADLAQALTPPVPVILVTAQGNEHVVSEAMHRGVAEYLRKSDGFWDDLVTTTRRVVRAAEAREALRETRQRLVQFIEWAPAAIAMFDTDMCYLAATRRWYQDFRLDDRDIIGRNHYEIFPDVPQRWRDIHRRCLAGAIESCAEDVFVREDGSIKRVRWEVRPWHHPGGDIGGILIWSEDTTAQHEARTALAESDSRFRGAFETAAHGMALVSPEGRWLKVNQALCTMLGYSEPELLTIDFQTVTHPEDLGKDLESLHDLLDGRVASYQMEKRYFHKHGGIVFVLLSVSLVRDERGGPRYFVSQIQDIGPRKAAEAKLRLVIDTVPNGILVVTESGIVRLANPYAETMFGYPAGALIDRNVDTLVPGALDAAHHGQDGPRSGGRDLRGLCADGRDFPVEVRLGPIDAPDGYQLVVSLTDLSVRKEMEASQARLAAIIEHSGDAIIGRDFDGIVTSWNPAAEALFGYAAHEIVGHSIAILFPASRRLEDDQFLDRIRRSESIQRYDTVHVRKDGSMVETMVSLSPVKDAAGRVVGVSKIIRDITERKRMENALRDAKDAAEAGDRAKGQFLANMSHEIRTPLNAILGLGSLLGQTSLAREQRDFVDKMTSAGRWLLGILNDILDFSKIDADRVELETADFRLDAIFSDLDTIMSVAGADKDLELAATFDPALPIWLRGDAQRLQQVMINLAGNAIKFTANGSVLVRADLVTRTDGEVRVRFSVRDTGIGISDAQLAKLFQPFSQADASTTRRFGGTGLGLVISKRLVELMHGRLEVESTPGIGSEFAFTVPFGIGQPPVEAPATRPVRARRLQGVRLLLVEDNLVNQEVARGVLEREGAIVEVVGDGLQAVEWLAARRDQVDVVLMDAQMPVMDGFEATRRVRASEHGTSLPIIALTGGVLQSDRDKCFDAGMTAFVTKPLDIDKLVEAINQHAPPRSDPVPR